MEQGTIRQQFRKIVCFFILGYLTIFLGEVITAATMDIFAGDSTWLNAAVVATGLAHVVVKLALPWIHQRLPYYGKIALLLSFCAAGLVIVVVSDSQGARLLGLTVVESGRAMAEVVFLSVTAFHGDLALNSFVTGGGLGIVMGAFYYSALSTWTCVSPRITVSFLIPTVCLFPVMYAFLDNSPVEKQSKNISFVGVHYAALPDQDERQKTHELSITEKFTVWWSIFMAMTYLFLQYFADQLSLQAVITSLVFPNKSLYLIGYYTYYMLAHNIGRLLGRSYLLIVSVTCSRVANHVKVKRTWILAALGNALMFWLVFASWFYLIGDIEVILVLCFMIGVLTGSTYANSFCVLGEQITGVKEKEFALGALTLGSSAGMYAARLLGLYLRPYFTHHCLIDLELGEACFSTILNMSGWTTNVRC